MYVSLLKNWKCIILTLSQFLYIFHFSYKSLNGQAWIIFQKFLLLAIVKIWKWIIPKSSNIIFRLLSGSVLAISSLNLKIHIKSWTEVSVNILKLDAAASREIRYISFISFPRKKKSIRKKVRKSFREMWKRHSCCSSRNSILDVTDLTHVTINSGHNEVYINSGNSVIFLMDLYLNRNLSGVDIFLELLIFDHYTNVSFE